MRIAALTRVWAGLPAIYWALFAGVFLMALATFVFPFLTLYLRSRGHSVEETGLLVALFGAGSIPAGPAAGWLADHVGRRPTLLGTLVLASAFTALLPFLEWPALVAAGTLVLGVAVHAYYPAASAVVADVVPPDRYGDAYALMYWERNAGIAVSFAIGGSLAAYGFERLFLLDAATTLLFAAVVLWKVPETRPVGRHGAGPAAGPGPGGDPPAPVAGASGGALGLAPVLRDVHFRRLMLLNMAFLLGLFQFLVVLPIHMTERGLSAADYGHAMAVNGVLIMVLSPWAGRLTEVLDGGRILAAGALLVGAGYGAYAVASTPLEFTLATGVWSLGEIATLPVVSSLVAKLSPPLLRGRYQGAFMMSGGAALALAPAAGGIVAGRLGPVALFAGVTALGVAVAALHLAAGRARAAAGVG